MKKIINLKSNIKTFFLFFFLFFPIFNAKANIDFYITNLIHNTKQNDDTIKLWNNLQNYNHVSEKGKDKTLRPKFVNFQAIFETSLVRLLQRNEIKALGIYLTPYPPTPLRTTPSQSVNAVVSEDMYDDQARLRTVVLRTQILREYLNFGGKLLCFYDKNKIQKDQISLLVYNDLIKKYANQIKDFPLDFSFKQNDIGVTYIIKDSKGSIYLFAINGYQAYSPPYYGRWQIWYGKPTESKEIKKKYNYVIKYLKSLKVNIDDYL